VRTGGPTLPQLTQQRAPAAPQYICTSTNNNVLLESGYNNRLLTAFWKDLLHVDMIAHNKSGIAYQDRNRRPETFVDQKREPDQQPRLLPSCAFGGGGGRVDGNTAERFHTM
jgi:hypothetical protein